MKQMTNTHSTKLGGRRLLTLLIVCGLLAATLFHLPRDVRAGDQLNLLLVWQRVADFNGENGSVESAEFSADGKRVATCSKYSNEIKVWRVDDGALLWSQTVEAEQERAGFSPDGKMLATGGEDALLRIWDALDGKLIKTFAHDQSIDALAWSHDGRMLVTGEEAPSKQKTNKVRVFSVPEMRVTHTLDHGETVNSIAFTSDDKLMASAGDNAEVRVWNTADMKLMRTLKNVAGVGFVTVRFSPDDRTLAASGFEGHVSVWNVDNGKRVERFNYTGRKVEAVEFSRDGRFLVVAGNDRCIRMFRTADFKLAYTTEPTDNVEYVSFSPNGAFLVSAHQDGIVRLWRVMSDDPGVNTRNHEALKERQAAEAENRRRARQQQ